MPGHEPWTMATDAHKGCTCHAAVAQCNQPRCCALHSSGSHRVLCYHLAYYTNIATITHWTTLLAVRVCAWAYAC